MSVDCVKQINQCLDLVSSITGIKNKFYLINICIKLIDISFDYYKELYPSEIRILIAYAPCIKHLTIIKSKLEDGIEDKKQLTHKELINTFTSTLFQQDE